MAEQLSLWSSPVFIEGAPALVETEDFGLCVYSHHLNANTATALDLTSPIFPLIVRHRQDGILNVQDDTDAFRYALFRRTTRLRWESSDLDFIPVDGRFELPNGKGIEARIWRVKKVAEAREWQNRCERNNTTWDHYDFRLVDAVQRQKEARQSRVPMPDVDRTLSGVAHYESYLESQEHRMQTLERVEVEATRWRALGYFIAARSSRLVAGRHMQGALLGASKCAEDAVHDHADALIGHAFSVSISRDARAVELASNEWLIAAHRR